MLNSAEHEIENTHKYKKKKEKKSMEVLDLNIKNRSFILLINVKTPTLFGILTFISRINVLAS